MSNGDASGSASGPGCPGQIRFVRAFGLNKTGKPVKVCPQLGPELPPGYRVERPNRPRPKNPRPRRPWPPAITVEAHDLRVVNTAPVPGQQERTHLSSLARSLDLPRPPGGYIAPIATFDNYYLNRSNSWPPASKRSDKRKATYFDYRATTDPPKHLGLADREALDAVRDTEMYTRSSHAPTRSVFISSSEYNWTTNPVASYLNPEAEEHQPGLSNFSNYYYSSVTDPSSNESRSIREQQSQSFPPCPKRTPSFRVVIPPCPSLFDISEEAKPSPDSTEYIPEWVSTDTDTLQRPGPYGSNGQINSITGRPIRRTSSGRSYELGYVEALRRKVFLPEAELVMANYPVKRDPKRFVAYEDDEEVERRERSMWKNWVWFLI